jgi:hypothetical protein
MIKVSRHFLLYGMSRYIFVKWVKLFFVNASETVNHNGNLGDNFKIEIGVRQGCSLTSYLFLIVGEIFTHMIK